MIRTDGLYHLHLVVADVQRSLRFYEDTFGVTVEFWAGDDMVFVRHPNGVDLLTLNSDPDLQDKVGDNGGLDHFGFRLAADVSMDDAIDEIVRNGGTLDRRGEHSPGQPYAYCRDPDGYLFEI
ncbi:MAG TPA: VOC family protein [Acidimicrobiales bacterium]|nr:VOC family protein [Acidimicrobiales bacterium]